MTFSFTRHGSGGVLEDTTNHSGRRQREIRFRSRVLHDKHFQSQEPRRLPHGSTSSTSWPGDFDPFVGPSAPATERDLILHGPDLSGVFSDEEETEASLIYDPIRDSPSRRGRQSHQDPTVQPLPLWSLNRLRPLRSRGNHQLPTPDTSQTSTSRGDCWDSRGPAASQTPYQRPHPPQPLASQNSSSHVPLDSRSFVHNRSLDVSPNTNTRIPPTPTSQAVPVSPSGASRPPNRRSIAQRERWARWRAEKDAMQRQRGGATTRQPPLRIAQTHQQVQREEPVSVENVQPVPMVNRRSLAQRQRRAREQSQGMASSSSDATRPLYLPPRSFAVSMRHPEEREGVHPRSTRRQLGMFDDSVKPKHA